MLTIDTKEGRSNPTARRGLFTLLGEDVEVDNLLSGDFAATDTPLTLGIEHKSFNDLVGSLTSGRLDEQLSRLLSTYDVPVLLVDEMPAPTPNGKLAVYGARHRVNYAWMAGALHGWSLRGVMVDRVRTPSEVAPAVVSWYRVVAKAEHRDTYEPKRLLDNLRPMSQVERVLIQLPGVGPERAAKLAPHVTLAGLSALDCGAWQAHLGPITGKRAWEAWHGS